VPWLAPNVFGSPSFGAAEANAVQGIYAGTATYGPAGNFTIQPPLVPGY
jgi:hypothetical protein